MMIKMMIPDFRQLLHHLIWFVVALMVYHWWLGRRRRSRHASSTHKLGQCEQAAHLCTVATAFPPYRVGAEHTLPVIDHVMELYHHPSKNQRTPQEVQHFANWQKKIVKDGGVQWRRSCFNSWQVYTQSIRNNCSIQDCYNPNSLPEEDDLYNSCNWNPPAQVRAEAYRYHSTKLALEACQKAIDHWCAGDGNNKKDQITHVIGVTTSGWDEPGLANKVIGNLGLSSWTEKYELVFNGCFAGLSGLRLAKTIAESNPQANILVVAVEVTTVHYNSTSFDKGLVLGNHLFGDGAAAAIVSSSSSSSQQTGGDSWILEDFGNYKVPSSDQVLRMHPSTNEEHGGFEMTLSKELSTVLKNAFTGPFGRYLVRKIIARCGLIPSQRPAFCLHPGGKRILDHVSKAVAHLRLGTLPQDNFDTMAEYGNMATVSIFAVLESYLAKPDDTKDDICLLAFGPGVTIEHGFLKKRRLVSKKKEDGEVGEMSA